MITATANLGSTITATARLMSEQVGSCLPATVHNSNNSYSTTVASGGDLPLPDNAIELEDSAGNTLSTTNVPATNSQTIVAPNGVAVLKDSGGVTLSNNPVRSGQTLNITAPDGSVANSNSSYTAAVKSGGSLSLPDTTINVNGSLLVNQPSTITKNVVVRYANGTPTGTIVSGEVEVANPVTSRSLSIGLSTSTPNYASSLTITATPSGISPTTYTFFVTNTVGECFMVTQAGNVYAYTVLIAGTLKVSIVGTDGSNDVGADAPFTCDNLSTITKAAEFIYAHNNATGLTMASVQRSAITTLVNNLNGSGTTNSSQFLARMVAQGSKFYPYCPVDNSTANANAYKMCLINPSANLTFTNFVAGDFTSNGLTGGATKQASTGVAMNAYLAQRTGFHAYCRTNSATGGLQAIGNGVSGGLEFWLRDGGQCYVKINNASTYTNAAVADSLALFSSSVKIGTSTQIYKRGVLVTTGAAAASMPSSADIKLHSGGGVNYETRQFAGFCIGFTPETTNEWADWYQLWQTYQTNVITGGRHV